MALEVGSRLGHYDVTALIGEGGMGQVYRATDTQLGRDVALKVLPDAFAEDADRLARFQREAQVLASLNHPGIAAIYGLEESGDTRALVLELVEGPTLADRIAKGPIPLGGDRQFHNQQIHGRGDDAQMRHGGLHDRLADRRVLMAGDAPMWLASALAIAGVAVLRMSWGRA
mgnify:CR=1 FL=1